MAPLISCQSVSKSYSSRPLFNEITLMIDDNERLGLIGPNGSGKSTLMKIFAGLISPDSGNLTQRKGLRAAYVPQDEKFPAEKTVFEIMLAAVPEDTEEYMKEAEAAIMLTKMEFEDTEQLAGKLSGGWRKRLSIACQLIRNPDLLLLDEPTNHLDLEGVLWLENLLAEARFAIVLITHDRTFLENSCDRIVELNKSYAEGYLSVAGGYSDFLMQREQYMNAQANLEQSMASKVRREIAWLARGAKARQRKSSSRIKEAAKLMDAHAEVKFRNNQNQSIEVDFAATGRKTRELLVVKGIEKTMGDRKLFADLEFALRPGTKLGLQGRNGSGKTILLRILTGDLPPDKGTIKRADGLRVVMFDQNRAQLDQTKTLKEALAPSGDAVVYRDRSLHVATWAKKFLFSADQLPMPISYLSGGEQARILIANLMLQPADVLILDEPTNDLDIPSLEVLEDNLAEFPGAVVLVTHDRFLLDNVSNAIIDLNNAKNVSQALRPDPNGLSATNAPPKEIPANAHAAGKHLDIVPATPGITPTVKASSSTASANGGSATSTATAETATAAAAPSNAEAKKLRPLSTNEKKELEGMSLQIEQAEQEVQKVESQLGDPKVAANHVKLQEIMVAVEAAKRKTDKLYKRWDELEKRSQA